MFPFDEPSTSWHISVSLLPPLGLRVPEWNCTVPETGWPDVRVANEQPYLMLRFRFPLRLREWLGKRRGGHHTKRPRGRVGQNRSHQAFERRKSSCLISRHQNPATILMDPFRSGNCYFLTEELLNAYRLISSCASSPSSRLNSIVLVPSLSEMFCARK
jgi:hypothetical protein